MAFAVLISGAARMRTNYRGTLVDIEVLGCGQFAPQKLSEAMKTKAGGISLPKCGRAPSGAERRQAAAARGRADPGV